MLQQAFAESGSNIRLRVSVATASSLAKLLALARSRKGIVLHLAAHAITSRHEQKGLGLVLEDPRGGAHVLWREELEDLLSVGDGLSNISLLFLSTCFSEELAQIFVENGCRHVIATRERVHDSTARRFAQQFYYELSVKGPLLTAWESARQALRIDPDENAAAQADQFMLYGQHGADRANLDTLCCGGSQLPVGVAVPMGDFEDGMTFLDAHLPARPENFVGRTQMMHAICHIFRGPSGRRACVVHGPKGIGKTALGVEFAHFVAAPGRAFSCCTMLLRIGRELDMDNVTGAIEQQLENLATHLGLVLRQRTPLTPSRSNTNTSLSSSPSYSEGLSTARGSYEDNAPPRAKIRDLFQQLERARSRSRILIIIDDDVGAIALSAEVRRLLGDILDHTRQVHFLAFSREPVYESWGATKVVNESLSVLSEMEAAKLFLQRIHRPLRAQDLTTTDESSPNTLGRSGAFPAGRSEGASAGLSQTPVNPSTREGLLLLLCKHPLLRKLGGHPGNICTVASRVTPAGPSLHELAELEDLVEEPCSPQRTLGALQRQRSAPVGKRPTLVDATLRPSSACPLAA
jgi:hypothetical protein